MFVIKADIQLTDQSRKNPIQGNTYRPMLFFSDTIIRSGLLVLEPGELLEMTGHYKNRTIKIYFHEDLDTEKEFYPGCEFTLRAGGSALIGKGIVTAVPGKES